MADSSLRIQPWYGSSAWGSPTRALDNAATVALPQRDGAQDGRGDLG